MFYYLCSPFKELFLSFRNLIIIIINIFFIIKLIKLQTVVLLHEKCGYIEHKLIFKVVFCLSLELLFCSKLLHSRVALWDNSVLQLLSRIESLYMASSPFYIYLVIFLLWRYRILTHLLTASPKPRPQEMFL